MADDEQGQGSAGDSQTTDAETSGGTSSMKSALSWYASSAMSWISSKTSGGGAAKTDGSETALANVGDSAASDSPWWTKVISKDVLGSVSKKATEFIRAQLAAPRPRRRDSANSDAEDAAAGMLSAEEMGRRAQRSSEQGCDEIFLLEDGGLDGDEVTTDGTIPASLATLLTTSPGSVHAEKAELEHWLVEHDCGAACDSVELLVSRGVNLQKLLKLAPESLKRTLPFLGLGHRCLLQHTLERYHNSILNDSCLANFDELLDIEAKFAANLLSLQEFWKDFPATLDLHLYTSSTGSCPRNKDELCALYAVMYRYSAAAVDALQSLRTSGNGQAAAAASASGEDTGAQGGGDDDEVDSIKAADLLLALLQHIPFKSAGGFTYSALFESLNEFVKSLEHPSSGDSAPKGKTKATKKQKADIKRARALVQEFNYKQAQIPSPGLNSLLIAPLQNFFHTRNIILKLFEDLGKDKWVSEENKRKAEELLNKCTEMLRCIDQDCEVPVQGTFFVSPDERRGFRKARFVFNSDYVCWSMNEKVYQRSWSEFTVSMTEETERIVFTKRSGATGDDVYIICKPVDRRAVWFRTIKQFEQEYLRKQKVKTERLRLASATKQ